MARSPRCAIEPLPSPKLAASPSGKCRLADRLGRALAREIRRRSTRLLVRNHDLTLACVDHEYGKQLRRSRGTGILADLVMIPRLLHPALAGLISMLRRVVHLAADRSLQHARIDEDRTSVGWGKSESVRVVLGGWRTLNK